jgi:arabinofuranosyltransferase
MNHVVSAEAMDSTDEARVISQYETRAPEPRSSNHSVIQFAALATATLFFMGVLRAGWVSDDAFIAIRSVDNLVNGNGFVVNLGERVQSFTSPLWALLCIPFFALVRNPYTALVVPGLVCTLGLALVVVRSFRANYWKAGVTLLALSASTSFLHFSTSGLENSLAHLLAALFVFERWQTGRKPTRLGFLLVAGLFLTRFDYALLAAPVVLWVCLASFRRALRLAVPALILTFAWLGFATFYYGFPFPNTAYAKLNTAISFSEQLGQGITYLVDSACRDPLVLSVIAFTGFLVLRKNTPATARALYLGVVLYVAYVVCIGGDFMSGRFLTTAYLVCVLLATQQLAAQFSPWALPATAATLVLLALPGLADRRADPMRSECYVPASGIVDERQCYVDDTNLAQNVRNQKWKNHVYLREFAKAASETPGPIIVYDLVGLVSYANQQHKHIVERFGLTEPLLARIKFVPHSGWRIGHFFRELPNGYLDTLRTGKNVIEDPCAHDLYSHLARVTHGSLWSLNRLASIWRLNTGRGTCPAP